MNILFDPTIARTAPGMKIGYAIIEDVAVTPRSAELDEEITGVVKEVRARYPSTSALYAANPIVGMRAILKTKGIDPTRYRPSAEALMKRVLDGKELYRINNVVDCNNLGSLLFALPMGVYNLDAIVGDILFKFGEQEEFMQTMAKGKLHVAGLLVSADHEKVFGSPISDSPYTLIAGDTRRVVLLVYGPPNLREDVVHRATEHTADRIAHYSHGKITEQGVK